MGILDSAPVIPKFNIDEMFVPLDKAIQKRGLKVGVYGSPGTGKTRFALTFPKPIFVLDTERGTSVLEKYFSGENIRVLEIFQKGKNGEKDEVECFEKIKLAVDAITENIKEGTIVIDSGTDLWKFAQTYGKIKIFNLSPEARLKQRFDWGKINNLYEQIISLLIHSSLNVVFTGKIANKFDASGQDTGETASRWQKDTEYHLDVIIEVQRIITKDKPLFYGTIEKCRLNGDVMGQRIDNIDFDKLKEKLK